MSAPDLVAGQVVGGKFTVRRERARTASTASYEAITAPSRGVELKVLDPSVRQRPDLEARMHRTMSATNQLPASLALQVLGVGIDGETGAPFLATELSVSPSLAELVQLCPLGTDEVIAFARNLGTALDAAHAQGLTHLALSPDNVFVGPAPRFEVRLSDFGSALLLGAEGSDPRWAAPELAATPGPACDVFSAGLIVLFAATGATLRERSPAALAAPATALARETGGQADARFDAPLARALAADATRRYMSVPELAEALAQAFGKLSPDPDMSSRPRLVAAPVADAAAPPSAPAMLAARPHLEPPALARPPFEEPGRASPPAAAYSASAPFTPSAPFAPARRGRVVFVAGGIAAALLVFAIVGWTLSRRVDAAPSAPSSSASGAEVANAPGTASPPAPVIAPAAPASAAAAAGPARLTVACTPECDGVSVDGTTITSFPADVAAGAHTVVARRGAHPPQTQHVTLAAHEEQTVSFVFFATRPPVKAKKNCGKFLQRCD